MILRIMIKSLVVGLIFISICGWIGTGTIISNDGLVLTNHHVAPTVNTYYVYVGKKKYKAIFIKTYSKNDLSIIKIVGYKGGCTPIARYNDNLLFVLAFNPPGYLGAPILYYETTVSSPNIDVNPAEDGLKSISTDILSSTAVVPGNSGSPILNSNGEIVLVIWGAIMLNNVNHADLAVPNEYVVEFTEGVVCKKPTSDPRKTVVTIEHI